MALVALCVLILLQLGTAIWGQMMTHPPVTPTFDPPPTFPFIPENRSFVAFIGEPITVPTDIMATIDCGPLIDNTTMPGEEANITWFKNNRVITANLSEVDVLIAEDERSIIITRTALGSPAQVGTDGNYSCEVCVVGRTCQRGDTITDVCVPPTLNKAPEMLFTASPPALRLTCGESAEAPIEGFLIVQLLCTVFNGTDLTVQTIFKDGVDIMAFNVLRNPTNPATSDDYGDYLFVAENACGRDTALTRILRPGLPPDIDEGPFVVQPTPNIPLGDMTVDIASDAYIIAGSDLTIVCDLEENGTLPITISWCRNGAPDGRFGNQSVIVVTNIPVGNNGDTYTCKAENIIGSDEETTTVNVFEPPQVVPVPFPTPGPGQVTVSTGDPTDPVVPTGTSVSIYCPVTGVDDPNIVWLKDGAALTIGGRITETAITPLPGSVVTRLLTIDDFQPTDVGDYQCTATNVAGVDSGVVTLAQQPCPVCPPTATETLSIDPDDCPICGEWVPGPFGACSLECHLGVQTRVVECIDLNRDNVTIDDVFCDASDKPAEQQNCGAGPCATGWRKGPWTKCSRTCQTGYQVRTVECIRMGMVVSDSRCDGNTRPKSERFCNGHIPCPPCKDEYPVYCPSIMGTPDCMKLEYMQACCWSCGGD